MKIDSKFLFGSNCQDYDFCSDIPCQNMATCLLTGIQTVFDVESLKWNKVYIIKKIKVCP